MSLLSSRRLTLEHLESRLVPTATTFVQGLYREVLHRDGSAAEVSSWVGAMEHGTGRDQVALGFFHSHERHSVEVGRLYKELLHRSADAGGLAGWTDQVDHGRSLRDVAESILMSAEYSSKHGDDSGFVRGLYEDALHRSGSVGEIESWRDHIGQHGRERAVDGVLDSLERASWRAETYYREFLGRNGSLEDRSAHAHMTAGGREDDLARNFLTSVEFEIHTKLEIEHGVVVATEIEIERELEIEHGPEIGHGGNGGDDINDDPEIGHGGNGGDDINDDPEIGHGGNGGDDPLGHQ